MATRSAGLLPYRFTARVLEVFLVHPGGPFWSRKDDGAWTIAKGEVGEGEEPVDAARREFREETSFEATGELRPLGEVKQPGGKIVAAWAFRGDFDPGEVVSNSFEMEWPPHSGRRQKFPEVDRAAWFTLDVARVKILRGQAPLLDRLGTELAGG